MTSAMGKKGKAPKKPDDYSVGYGKPPTGSRFKKGVSGNPSGRPKGSSVSLHDRFLKEAERMVKIKGTGGKITKMPKIDVIIRKVLEAAMQGKPEAQRLALAYLIQAHIAKTQANGTEPMLSDDTVATFKMLVEMGVVK